VPPAVALSIVACARPVPWALRHDGVVLAEGTRLRGERTGSWTLRYRTGEVAAEGGYVRGLRSGPWRFAHRSGAVLAEGRYEAGVPDGRWVWRDEAGRSVFETTFSPSGPDPPIPDAGEVPVWDREEVRARMLGFHDLMEACWALRLRRRVVDRADVRLVYDVAVDGRVTSVRLEDASGIDDAMESCVAEIVYDLDHPLPPRPASLRVIWPLIFLARP
jgi:hypothetical protein